MIFSAGVAPHACTAQPQSLMAEGAEIQNATFALQCEPLTPPTAIFRASRIYTDHQRRGFFKLGVLPMIAADDVSIEILDPTEWLRAPQVLPHPILKSTGASKWFEARGFRLFLSKSPQNGIRARIARLQSPTELLLINGSLNPPGRPAIAFNEGTLILTGDRAGLVRLRTEGGICSGLLPKLLIPKKEAPL